jgi:hypothetical protein
MVDKRRFSEEAAAALDERHFDRRRDDYWAGIIVAKVDNLTLAVERIERTQNDKIAVIESKVDALENAHERSSGAMKVIMPLVALGGVIIGKLWDWWTSK